MMYLVSFTFTALKIVGSGDPEDIWIECPETRIEEGYWTGKIIPPYMAEYIVWLDLFFPNIPEFYLKKEEKKEEVVEEKKEEKKGCIIF